MLQRYFRKLWTWYLFFYYLLHMKMKKMLLGAFFGMFALAGIAVLPNVANAQDPNAGQDSAASSWANPAGNKNYVGTNQTLTGSAILDTIKNAINWILGILATIALIICLYGGFLMVTAAGDEKKYQKGLGVLKYAAIGLAIIGLSWMIVSVIFWFVGTLSGKNQTQADTHNEVQKETGEGTSLTEAGGSDTANTMWQGAGNGGSNCSTDENGTTICS